MNPSRLARRRASILLAGAALALSPAAARAGEPEQLARSTVEAMTSLAGRRDLGAAGLQQARQDATAQAFDLADMAARCLARTWRNLVPSQRQEFVALFSRVVAADLASEFARLQGPGFQFREAILRGGRAEVSARPENPGQGYREVVFRLKNTGGGWAAYDVVFDGSSMVEQKRRGFERVIQQTSYEGLVRRLRQKAAPRR